jgi:hypothetical protein
VLEVESIYLVIKLRILPKNCLVEGVGAAKLRVFTKESLEQ